MELALTWLDGPWGVALLTVLGLVAIGWYLSYLAPGSTGCTTGSRPPAPRWRPAWPGGPRSRWR